MNVRVVLGWAALASLALLTTSSGLEAQEAGGEVRGRVVETGGAPIAGAVATLNPLGRAGETNEQGTFVLRDVPAGGYTLSVRRLGFGTFSARVSVAAGEVVGIDVVLEVEAIALQGLTVIGSRQELDQVRVQLRDVPGSVVLLEPADLRQTRQANFADVLRFTPGVFAQPRFGAADEMQFSIRGSGLRNNFHLRGVNVLVNGMPYRLADGFTDFESPELLTTDNIQVYKGANASLTSHRILEGGTITRSHRLASSFAAAAILATTFAGAVLAHAVVYPAEAPPGAYQRYTLRVPNERAFPTDLVAITFPAGVRVISFDEVPGWTIETASADEGVTFSGARWSGTIPVGRFVEFGFIGVNPTEEATLKWDVVQTYQDGTVVEWTGPVDSPTPASLTLVRASLAAAPEVAAVAPAAPTSNTPMYLGEGALVLALVSLGVSLRPRGGAA